MAKEKILVISDLRKLVRYDAETGIIIWNYRKPGLFPDGQYYFEKFQENWNHKFANKNAGYVDRRGYISVKVCRMLMPAHRVIWALHYDAWPEGHIDHINGDQTNNQITNLRQVTPAENLKNLSINLRNTSGITGVTFDKNLQKWRAQISVNNRTRYIGVYGDMETAALARKNAERLFGFHDNHGRPKFGASSYR